MQAHLMVADYANVTADQKLNVVGTFNQINATSFPARHVQMYVVIQIVADIGETSEERKFVVKLLDEDNQELGRVEGSFQFPEASGGKRPEANILFQIDDLVFMRPGEHVFVLLVDNQNVADRTLVVNQIVANQE